MILLLSFAIQTKENNPTVTYKFYETTCNKTLNYKEAVNSIQYIDEEVVFSLHTNQCGCGSSTS